MFQVPTYSHMSAPQMGTEKGRGECEGGEDSHISRQTSSDYQNHILYSQNTTLQGLFRLLLECII